ncbi:PKD domain-containing protein [Oligoflexia bacterium]|nr:PKD domain-containing protein [Oligoflexia bacterium]
MFIRFFFYVCFLTLCHSVFTSNAFAARSKVITINAEHTVVPMGVTTCLVQDQAANQLIKFKDSGHAKILRSRDLRRKIKQLKQQARNSGNHQSKSVTKLKRVRSLLRDFKRFIKACRALVKHCYNGVQDDGEEGVDCDGSCSETCTNPTATPTPFVSPTNTPVSTATPTSVPTTTPGTFPECSDGIDNDQDGLIDYPQDSGCSSKSDDDEIDPPGNVTLVAKIIVGEDDSFKNNSYFPSPVMSLTKGYAPHAVFFEGHQSTPRAKLVKYAWDFGAGTEGDPEGRYGDGFNTAHVFETPGIYTVTLKVMDHAGAWSAYDTINIEVLSRTQHTTFYVDAVIGNDNFDGKCLTVNGSCGPWKTATKAFEMLRKAHAVLSSGDQVLFKRGQVFLIDQQISLSHGEATQGILYAAYGNELDPKPLIQWNGPHDEFVINGQGVGFGHISFTDLEVNFLAPSNNQASGFFISFGEDKQILFLRCDFYEPLNGALGATDMHAIPAITTAFFVVDSTFQNPTTNDIAVTQFFAFGVSRLALINNTFDKSGNHIAYTTYVDKGVVRGNIFSRPAFGRTALRMSGGPYDHPTNNVLISKNHFLGWIDPLTVGSAHNGGGNRYNYTLVDLAPNTPDQKALTEITFERNVISNCENCLSIANMHNSEIKNNLIISPAENSALVHVGNYRDWDLRPILNLDIIGNTFVRNGRVLNGQTPFIEVYPFDKGQTPWGDKHQNVNIKNNIFFAIDDRNARPIRFEYADTPILAEFDIDYNLYHVPGANQKLFRVNATDYTLSAWQNLSGHDSNSLEADPLFVDSDLFVSHQPGEPLSQQACVVEASSYVQKLQLKPQSPAIDTGESYPNKLFFDFLGQERPLNGNLTGNAHFDIGAFEYEPVVP